MFICAGQSESFEFAKSIGIGLIDSARELTKICLQQAPQQLIFIGSAGSYDKTKKIGDIFYSFCATQLELSFLQNNSYTPIDNSIKLEEFQIVSHETLSKKYYTNSLAIPHVIVNSSNYITNTSKYNTMFLHAGITLENMEFFSVLKTAEYFKIPAVGIFCISNFVGENAHQEFLQNQNLIKTKLQDFINLHFFTK